jgi:hypothetical protein
MTTIDSRAVSQELIAAGNEFVRARHAERQAAVAIDDYVTASALADPPIVTVAVGERLNELLAELSAARAAATLAAEELARVDTAVRAKRQGRRRKPTNRQLAAELAERNHRKAHEAFRAERLRMHRRLAGLNDDGTPPPRAPNGVPRRSDPDRPGIGGQAASQPQGAIARGEDR